ncbi:MAG: peroxiredoxin [Leptospirales bacterium]
MLIEGDKVPKGLDVILVDPEDADHYETGKKVKLDTLWKEGAVVLYFYPRDNTPGCTTEAKDFQEALAKISKSGTRVIGCSRDNVKSHCKFIGKLDLKFPLLSDEEGKVTEAFGVWVEKKLYGKVFMGIQRSTFVIEKGKIIKSYPKVKVKEHVGEILEYLKSK